LPLIVLPGNKKMASSIGKEVSTGFGGTDIFYGNPKIEPGSDGNALFFYINETGRSPRVSPIINATQLAWGAMGRPVTAGINANGYYYPTLPFATLDRDNGNGISAGSISATGDMVRNCMCTQTLQLYRCLAQAARWSLRRQCIQRCYCYGAAV